MGSLSGNYAPPSPAKTSGWAKTLAAVLIGVLWFLYVMIVFWNLDALRDDGLNAWNLLWLIWGISGLASQAVMQGIKAAKAWDRLENL
jgi:hypothetical protein